MQSDDYDRKVKDFERDLEQFPAFRDLLDLEPEEIQQRYYVVITELKQELEVIEREIKLVTQPKYRKMMQSDKEVREVEILRIKQVTDQMIELKRQHEEHLF